MTNEEILKALHNVFQLDLVDYSEKPCELTNLQMKHKDGIYYYITRSEKEEYLFFQIFFNYRSPKRSHILKILSYYEYKYCEMAIIMPFKKEEDKLFVKILIFPGEDITKILPKKMPKELQEEIIAVAYSPDFYCYLHDIKTEMKLPEEKTIYDFDRKIREKQYKLIIQNWKHSQ
jgi:hypothetical protein